MILRLYLLISMFQLSLIRWLHLFNRRIVVWKLFWPAISIWMAICWSACWTACAINWLQLICRATTLQTRALAPSLRLSSERRACNTFVWLTRVWNKTFRLFASCCEQRQSCKVSIWAECASTHLPSLDRLLSKNQMKSKKQHYIRFHLINGLKLSFHF